MNFFREVIPKAKWNHCDFKTCTYQNFKICNYNYELYILFIIVFLYAIFSSFFFIYFSHSFFRCCCRFLLAHKSFSSTQIYLTDPLIWASKLTHCCFIFVGYLWFVCLLFFSTAGSKFWTLSFMLIACNFRTFLSFSLLLLQSFELRFRKGLKDITIELWKLPESVHNLSSHFLFFSRFDPGA